MIKVEDVFKTEGIPEFTFIRPPNYSDILIDIRTQGKPVIIEGQSGTGKTTAVKKIIAEALVEKASYYTPRETGHVQEIEMIVSEKRPGLFVIDDFHRLEPGLQEALADMVKLSAEKGDNTEHPKLVIIGINKLGSSLIELVHDLGKRVGIHRITPADRIATLNLISLGEEKLNIIINNKELIYDESKGDYWLTQLLARTICSMNEVTEKKEGSPKGVAFTLSQLRSRVISRLEHSYDEPIKAFCRGNKFRPTNDPYFKLLVAISKQDNSIVDLTELANSLPDVKGSINNVKKHRLSVLLADKEICKKYFYYNSENTNFAIEDPALFYYLKIVDWEKIKKECGFRSSDRDFEFDFAISFSGERRDLAREIVGQLEMLDISVFFDEHYEDNYLGRTWGAEFKKVFAEKSRLVVCLLDKNHSVKIWPTFERDCFSPRVKLGEVIPIFLDDTIFPGIPSETSKISFDPEVDADFKNRITDQIAYRLFNRLALDRETSV